MSKKLTENINDKLREKLKYNQWKNTGSAVKWYCRLQQKHKLKFIQADMKDFYGNITEELFTAALEWAGEHVEISDETKEILIQSKKSFLFHSDEPWRKKGGKNFDITMGSFDGAESCDLVGLYLLSQLDLGMDIGLYRDDVLAVSKFSPRKPEQIKKKICKIFEKNGLEITITAN